MVIELPDSGLILQNDKIILRPLVTADYQVFKKLTCDKSIWIYFTNDLSVEEVLTTWIDDAVNEADKKIRIPFTIIDRTTGKVAGSTSIGNISVRDKRAEIGWTWISREYQGTGINRQSKFLMITYIFDILGFERVEFKTDVLNIPARKALLKIGAGEEGILRSHTLMTNNRRRDTIYYSILKQEWNGLKMQNPS